MNIQTNYEKWMKIGSKCKIASIRACKVSAMAERRDRDWFVCKMINDGFLNRIKWIVIYDIITAERMEHMIDIYLSQKYDQNKIRNPIALIF